MVYTRTGTWYTQREEHPSWGGRKLRRVLMDRGHEPVQVVGSVYARRIMVMNYLCGQSAFRWLRRIADVLSRPANKFAGSVYEVCCADSSLRRTSVLGVQRLVPLDLRTLSNTSCSPSPRLQSPGIQCRTTLSGQYILFMTIIRWACYSGLHPEAGSTRHREVTTKWQHR